MWSAWWGWRSKPRILPAHWLGENRESRGAATLQAKNCKIFFSLSFISSKYLWRLFVVCFSNIVRMWVTSISNSPRRRQTWHLRINCSWWIWTRQNSWDSRFSIRSLCNTFKRMFFSGSYSSFTSFLVHLPLRHSGLSHPPFLLSIHFFLYLTIFSSLYLRISL